MCVRCVEHCMWLHTCIDFALCIYFCARQLWIMLIGYALSISRVAANRPIDRRRIVSVFCVCDVWIVKLKFLWQNFCTCVYGIFRLRKKFLCSCVELSRRLRRILWICCFFVSCGMLLYFWLSYFAVHVVLLCHVLQVVACLLAMQCCYGRPVE